MKVGSKVVPLRQRLIFFRRRLINFTGRALRRLRFFPFTLLHVMHNAVISLVQRRRGHLVVCVGEASEKAMALLPRSVMLWLDRVLTGPTEYQYYVCLRLPREEAVANLHEVFSVLLTFPRLRAAGLYWDATGLADELSLLQVKQDQDDPAVRATSYEDLGSLGVKQFEEFLQADHVGIDLPVAAIRDAQTLLKRQAGKAYAVCLNVPEEFHLLADAVVAARPDVRFFDLEPYPLAPAMTTTANSQSFFDHGLTLHERMALVQAADAYVGSFDVLGCAALVFMRPTILLGGETGEQPDRTSRGDKVVWYHGSAEPATLVQPVLRFLSNQLSPPENC